MKPARASLVAIVGPTAVGKTEVAIAAAEALEAEIVSADSRLIYRGMDIGTAKPSPEQRARVPHHMIDVADPEENWSLAEFKQAAELAIEQIQLRHRLPLLVGGTGQYVTAILDGWDPPPTDVSIRRELEGIAAARGAESLYSELKAVDPVAALRIEPANVRRVVRALEIYRITGSPPSEQRIASPPTYRILRIGINLPRSTLYSRIDRRIDAMLEAGLVAEVQALLNRGIALDHPPMSAIGYRQIGEYLMGQRDRESAIEEIRKLTRQFVRRQANWFKPDDPEITWLTGHGEVAAELAELIRDWIGAD